ncbi:helix-turn-helix domain-containing protein [Vibrio sp. HN007]|uniref:helix-turn-helix domain-containing protein n=1 Tax=Vibrio iocasae TaxID=3098914 RepID=UPI0035D42BC8
MNKLDETICLVFKRRLKSAGLAYKDVAVHLGVSEVSVKRLLNKSQPVSMDRLIQLSELIQEPLSLVIAEAERHISKTPTFTMEQDRVFCEQPELYTIFSEICGNQRSSEIMEKFNLNESSLYLYLRKLESIELVEITSGVQFKLLVPRHICFSDSNRFPMFFKNQIIDGLKERVQEIHSDDAYFISAKLRLTEDEFREYNLKLEELMQESLKLTQTRDENTINTCEYTIVDMGAKGSFHPERKQPMNLTER